MPAASGSSGRRGGSGGGGEDRPAITFDDECNIRVLEASKFEKTKTLGETCKSFVGKLGDFSGTIQTLVDVLDASSSKIEAEKLRAIGQRNRVETEPENRKRKQRVLLALIQEHQAELERAEAQYQSLVKLETDQRALVERLSNDE